jgi:hypothetical protein
MHKSQAIAVRCFTHSALYLNQKVASVIRRSRGGGDIRGAMPCLNDIPRGLGLTFVACCTDGDEQIDHRGDGLTIGVGLLHQLVVRIVRLRS